MPRRRKQTPEPVAVTSELPPPDREIIERPIIGRPFTGRIASGRGRLITADDSSFAVESDQPLDAREIAIGQRNGFDVADDEGRLMIGEKKDVREAGGDINYVARIMVSGRGRGR